MCNVVDPSANRPKLLVMYVELQKRCNPTPPKADRAVGHYIFCNSSYATELLTHLTPENGN